jgi:putative addiction module CopG family antidote
MAKKLKTGQHQSTNEVVRAASRTLDHEEQKYEPNLAALRAAIDEGDASGNAAGNVFGRVRKTLKLPGSPRYLWMLDVALFRFSRCRNCTAALVLQDLVSKKRTPALATRVDAALQRLLKTQSGVILSEAKNLSPI